MMMMMIMMMKGDDVILESFNVNKWKCKVNTIINIIASSLYVSFLS